MKYKEFIGIDVSKKTLDVYILSVKKHFTVSNDTQGFAKLLEVCFSHVDRAEIFFCFENTGRYSRLLSIFLCENNIPFLMANALELALSVESPIRKMPVPLPCMPGRTATRSNLRCYSQTRSYS